MSVLLTRVRDWAEGAVAHEAGRRRDRCPAFVYGSCIGLMLVLPRLALAQDSRPGETAPTGTGAVATFVSSLERAFPDTPDGSGLLTIGLEEVDVARRHAELAVADTTDLAGMRLHAAHVLHALDPSRAAQGGPGAGFGVVRAAREIAERAEDLVGRDDISENVALHVEYMALAGRGALDRVEQAAELVDRIGRASSAFAALPWARDLVMATKDVLTGKDLDRNGRIEPDRGEAGLSPVRWHLTLLKRGEGTTSP